MKRLSLLAVAMCLSVGTASAADWTVSVDDRAEALNASLKGNSSYEAHLARELASVASEEKLQHDAQVAKAFMSMAEEHAAKAGGSK